MPSDNTASNAGSLVPEGRWQPGVAPVAVVLIALNEAHALEGALRNLLGWAQEVFLVDSLSRDSTVDIALRFGVHVVQRPFIGFGDQWNFAISELPISAPWTMKLDPDERITDQLKRDLLRVTMDRDFEGVSVVRRLWFMERPLPVRQRIVRAWRTGSCRFTDVTVNEHPIVVGAVRHLRSELEHHDSPDLEHWLEKQNRYTTEEAIVSYRQSRLAEEPKLLGTPFQRRMWLKRNFNRIPFRYALLFVHHWLLLGAWRAGWVGWAWAKLRCDVMRFIEYKHREILLTGRLPRRRVYGSGSPDPRVRQYVGETSNLATSCTQLRGSGGG